MPASDASCTSATTQTRRSRGPRVDQLKIMQQQVGHAWGSTTAIYTSVSDDFKNRVMDAAVAGAFTMPGTGTPVGVGGR